MQDNYFEPDLETAPREVLHWIQSRRLVKMVENCYNNVPLYKKRFDEMGLLPGDIKSIDDIHKLPFTYKTDRPKPVSQNFSLAAICPMHRQDKTFTIKRRSGFVVENLFR